MYRTLAEGLSYRVADILQYADFKDEFINKIGKYNVSILNDINELYMYDFGIFIEISPDEEQKGMLEQNIQMALSKGDINLEDAIDIREIRNLKLANQLLKVKRKLNKTVRRRCNASNSNASTDSTTVSADGCTDCCTEHSIRDSV
jgi:hypothetical protein